MTDRVVQPRAKLNLTLRVGQRGVDGFHALESIFLRIGLADTLAVGLVEAGTAHDGADRLVVRGAEPCPPDENLVLRAARALRDRLARPLPALAFTLDKRIPAAAGLGGGSSDAAAALELAAAAWGVRPAAAVMFELALGLGSDVPFFLHDADAALVGGRGEQVEPLPRPPALGVLLVLPQHGLSAHAVFRALDRARSVPTSPRVSGSSGVARRLAAARAEEDVGHLLDAARDANDLWPAAAGLVPALAMLRERLESTARRPFLLSGSGPGLFTLYPSPDDAVDAARAASAEEGAATVIATGLATSQPLWRTP